MPQHARGAGCEGQHGIVQALIRRKQGHGDGPDKRARRADRDRDGNGFVLGREPPARAELGGGIEQVRADEVPDFIAIAVPCLHPDPEAGHGAEARFDMGSCGNVEREMVRAVAAAQPDDPIHDLHRAARCTDPPMQFGILAQPQAFVEGAGVMQSAAPVERGVGQPAVQLQVLRIPGRPHMGDPLSRHVDFLDLAKAERGIASEKRRDEGPDRIGRGKIIGIDEVDEAAARSGAAQIARGGRSAIAALDDVMADARRARLPAGEPFGAAIGGAIIDHDDLKRTPALRDQRGQQFLQEGQSVEGGDDHRNQIVLTRLRQPCRSIFHWHRSHRDGRAVCLWRHSTFCADRTIVEFHNSAALVPTMIGHSSPVLASKVIAVPYWTNGFLRSLGRASEQCARCWHRAVVVLGVCCPGCRAARVWPRRGPPGGGANP